MNIAPDNKLTLKNSKGLSFNFLENGSLQSIRVGPIRISLKAISPFSKSGANIWLRKRTVPYEFIPLLGPESNSRFYSGENTFFAKGSWGGLDYVCILQLSGKSTGWQWHIDITNISAGAAECDLIYIQDVGLKSVNAGLINEYYVSQYLERRILEDKNHGAVICCRQNMKETTGNPWLMISCKNGAIAGATDGMQFYGKTYRESGIPESLLADRLGGDYAGESSVVALQERPFKLTAGGHHRTVFVAAYMADHREATSEDDLNRLPGLMNEFNDEISLPETGKWVFTGKNLFNTSQFLPVDNLDEEELDRFFGRERRHSEEENGRLLSFFCRQNDHVVLRAKEIMADRPHAHIMQAKTGFTPDENIVSTTAFAFGVFNSHITQGNTNFNVLLSICTSQFNQSPDTGQRIFVELDGHYFLLGVPSAFEIGLNHCRWIYKHNDHCFQVRTWTSVANPIVNLDFKVLSHKKVRLLVTHDFDPLNSWSIFPGSTKYEFVARPNNGSLITDKFPLAQFRIIINSAHADFKRCGDEALYSGKKIRENSLFVLDVRETSGFYMSFIGEVCSPVKSFKIKDAENQWLSDCQSAQLLWQDLSLDFCLKGDQADIAAIGEILPWYGMNALTHYLTPYGPEQFGGAAWGTRDVSQGPIDLLLTLEKYDQARHVLRTIFSNQNPDGGWPQWWMFDSYSDIRAGDSHGDVFYWVIIALANYIKVTGDLSILDEVLPYHGTNGTGSESTPVSEHIDCVIRMIISSFIPGTALVPFGGGDWNDSLQPVSRELAQRLISSWTVEMNFQAFMQYQSVFERVGNIGKAAELKKICGNIRADFNKHLIKDGIVAGYGLMEEDGSISVLLHPADKRTGIRYSILPMERGILSEIFTMEQALYHQDLIERYLKGPDGARLMDRPLQYRGGIQTIFQRAESSTFFGREIGLMYVHEHIRYAESQARTGKANELVKALRQAIPVAYRSIVPCGDIRQSNCYYSSSDVAFKSRYEADERYDEIKTGLITLRGGWRVYSSGPGIFVGMIVTRLLGLRKDSGNIILDPVLPYSLDGLSASMNFMGHHTTFEYSVKENYFSPAAVSINGKRVQFSYEENKYRKGGAVIPAGRFMNLLDQQENIVKIDL